MSNITMNLHNVSKVTLHPAREEHLLHNTSIYEVRQLTIETSEGSVTLTLFSDHVPDDSNAAPMITVNV